MIPSNLLPANTDWFIAGGYAACPALASDRDVWVTAETSDMDATRERILAHLETEFEKWQIVVLEPSQRQEGTYALSLKVARVITPGVPCEIIVTDAENAHALIDGFDVSTHQIAILPNGMVVKGALWTSITERPIKLRDSDTTDARMVKIATRYGHVKETAIAETSYEV